MVGMNFFSLLIHTIPQDKKEQKVAEK